MHSSAEFLQGLFGLDSQVAIVIGGTGVLGGALCDGLAAAGAHVIVAGRSQERGEARAAAIRDAGGSADFAAVDVTSRESFEQLRDGRAVQARTRRHLGENCAGVNSAVPYEEISDDDWQRVLDTNLKATHLGCQIFAPVMAAQQNGGSILNIGSVTAHLPLSRVFAYSASKAAVNNLTKNVAREYAQRGVRVNSLNPRLLPRRAEPQDPAAGAGPEDHGPNAHGALRRAARVGGRGLVIGGPQRWQLHYRRRGLC